MTDTTVDTATIPSYWVDHSAHEPQPALDKTWKKTVAHVGSVLLEDASGPPPENQMRWACHELDAMLNEIGGRGKFIFRASLLVVSLLAPLMIFRLPPIRRMSFEATAHALERFERSPLGMMLFAVQTMLCIVYFEHPDAAVTMDFDGKGLGQRFDQKFGGASPSKSTEAL